MDKQQNIIAKSYLTGLIAKCGLLFAAGLLLTGVILYFSAHQPLGPSYQATFARLAQLKQEMLVKSIVIYCLLVFLVTAGVVFITVIYSHRVVGPMVGLTRVVNRIKAGELDQKAVLRKKDAIQPMAHAINNMMAALGGKVASVQRETEALKVLVNRDDPAASAGEVRKKAEEIKQTLATFKL